MKNTTKLMKFILIFGMIDILLAGAVIYRNMADRVETNAGAFQNTTETDNSRKNMETGEKSDQTTADGEKDMMPDGDTKKVALTFDDGPHKKYTPQMLDMLKEHDVKATFFITGENAAASPKIVKRMQQEGHLIGNHTFHHTQLTGVNESVFKDEIVDTNQTIRKITGCDTEFIRPPYGSWKKKFEKELNMIPVLWTVDTLDWNSKDVGSIVVRGTKNTKENDIILMHDCYQTSVEAAGQIITILKEQGYTFVTVDEILFD